MPASVKPSSISRARGAAPPRRARACSTETTTHRDYGCRHHARSVSICSEHPCERP
jgi:hypothetical protein